MAEHNNLGILGEKEAAKFLKKQNYKILEKNFQNSRGTRLGEIDIIALDKKMNELVFVEVKTRSQNDFSSVIPEENITQKKLIRLQKAAQIYLRQKRWQEKPYRFDAISVIFSDNTKTPQFRHIIGL